MLGKYVSMIAIAVSACIPPLQAGENQEDHALMQKEIKHIVLLMMENRSFDNVLAWLYSNNDAPQLFIPENTDPHYLGLSEESLSQYTNLLKDPSGRVIFSCSPIKGVPSVAKGQYLNSPSTNPHEPFEYVSNQVFGFDGGTRPTMSGFLQDYAMHWDQDVWLDRRLDICAVLETHTDRELPVLYGLAKQYAVSDLWFSSVPSQTNPNRAFAACGTSKGQINNGPGGQSLFYSDTIWNRLTEESPETTWMIFWQSDMLPGLIRGPYTSVNTFPNLSRIPNLKDHYRKLDSFHELARRGQLPDFSYIEPQWTLCENLSTESLIADAIVDNTDLLGGLQGNDFHPPGDVRTAENLLANIYTSLIANQEAWEHTLLIVTFDEHGGIFDHVPPPASIAPDEHFENGFKFDRYGVRIPTIFISPKVPKSSVIRGNSPTTPFDHTSLIATLLKWKNIDKTKWKMGKRVEVAPTFESIVTLSESRKDSVIKPAFISLPKADQSNVVHMGDAFYLRDKNGNYLANAGTFFKADARFGSSKDRVTLSFVCGQGAITHGSFILIQSNDPALENANMLGTSLFHSYCTYAENAHDSGQWWTIKSLDHPYVGAEIQYGDRIYIENHIYLDPLEFLPARLTIDNSFFGEFLKAKAITEEGCEDNYWVLEKVDSQSLDYSPYRVSS
ncbi:MAG: hypothetical protein KGZ39_04725 [Simkania sp.]|nr:hypothetical protein [Simkania sp.]